MDELRRFVTVDNHEAVKVGDSEKNSVVLAMSTELFTEAVPGGAEELTLRRGEEGGLRTFIKTTNVGKQQMEAAARG